MPADTLAKQPRNSGLLLLRFGLPAVLTLAGFAILILDEGSRRYDGFAMCVGAALSLLFLTTVFTMGAQGDRERDVEEAAREYYRANGHWPDEKPTAGRMRG